MRSDHRLWYRREARVWEEALPLGNGRLGAMVFGGAASERIALNEDTLWSGYGGSGDRNGAAAYYPKARDLALEGRLHQAQQLVEAKLLGAFTQSYLPLGDLLIEFDNVDQARDYQRTLALDEAVCSTRFTSNGVNYHREAFVSNPDQAMYVLLEADSPGMITLSCQLTCAIRHKVTAQGNELVMRGVCPSNVVPSYIDCERPVTYARRNDRKGMRFEAVLDAHAEGGRVIVKAGRLRVEGADRVVLRLCARTSFNGFDRHPYLDGRDERNLVQSDMKRASQSYEDARARHVEDHARLYCRCQLALEGSRDDLPTDERLLAFDKGQRDDGLHALLFHYGRYLLIACSRPGSQPANLQGIWNRHLRAVWSCNFTLNINSQMNYWPAEPCNLSELHEPLFDMIEELLVTGRRTAQVHYNARGAAAHHNSDIWRLTNPVGEQYAGFAGCAFWPMSLGWLCSHLWMRYEYMPDPDFLRDRVLPALSECAKFYLDVMEPDDKGFLTIAPATSPENVFVYEGTECKVARSAQMTTSIAREVLRNYLRALDELQVDEPMAAQVRQALERLPDYRMGSKGQLLEWETEYEEIEPHHRHQSHLYDLYPGNAISPDQTPKWANACRRTLELRGDGGTGWSLGWKINLWASLGDGEHALSLLRRMLRPVDHDAQMNLTDGGSYLNLLDAHPPFQIDGNFGACAGIAQMLAQSREGEIHLLPALPRGWSGRAEGLRVRGGAMLDVEFREGSLVSARISTPPDKPRPRVLYKGALVDESIICWEHNI